MQRRLMVASVVAVVMAAAFLPGSGLGSSGPAILSAKAIPARLAAAIHARFGAGAIRRSSAFGLSAFGPGLGWAVALSADGTTALVGAFGAAHEKGAAYIFHVSDAGSWSSSDTPTAVLKLASTQHQWFGDSVALSADGTTAAIGAPLAFAGSDIGAVYVFHASAEDAWASSSTPTAVLRAQVDGIGDVIALSPDGTTLVAGTSFNGPAGGGGADVFHVSSESAWASTGSPTATLSNANQDPYDLAVGRSVAISGDGTTALISDSDNPNGGGAYVFHVASEAAWTTSTSPTAILTNANGSSHDFLGGAVALSGDGTVALLSAPGAGVGRGAVDVFHASGEAAWATTSTPAAILTAAGSSKGDGFGDTLAAASDGTTALVTSFRHVGGGGAGFIFHVADEGSWASSSAPTATLTDSGGHVNDDLGLATAFSADGATVLLGAPEVRFETGAADVFHAADASSWATSSTPNAILTDSTLNSCVVPKLKGLSVRAARSALKVRSCALGKVTRVHHTGKRRRIFFQSLKPGTRPPIGTKVAVKIVR